MSITAPTLSRRQKTDGPNHHLWNNHGTWWVHCTVHLPNGTASRFRRNLGTRDIAEARRKRDLIFRILNGEFPTSPRLGRTTNQ